MSGDKTFPKAFFLTGTDTDVGKTVVSAVLSLGLSAHYWKPVQSGQPKDSDFMEAAGLPREMIFPERYCFSQPLSPHLAARIDSQSIELSDFSLPDLAEVKHLVVEGAGGLLVPLNERDKVIDLIKSLALPVVLVARSALGTINHTLLSLEALRKRDIDVFGVIMTGLPNRENRLAIERFGDVAVLAEIPILPDFKAETLARCFADCFDKGVRRHADSSTKDLASVYADANSRPGA